MIPGLGFLWAMWNLHVASQYHNALPVVVAPQIISFHAHKRILPHPDDLLSYGRETIKTIEVVAEIDRNDVRPVIRRTSQPTEAKTHQQLATFPAPHSSDQHRPSPVRRRFDGSLHQLNKLWVAPQFPFT
jgi:hypothetical protein